MAEKFLNLSGLNTLWSKIKTALNGKANFLYGRVYVATSYNSANPYLLLASTNITFSANWQETSEFLIRLYDGSAANKTRTLKIQLNIGGTKTAIYDTKFFKRIYQINLTDEQASAIRVRYTFVEGECKFWIYFDRTKFQTTYTCIHIQPQSIGKGDRSNTISNGLNYWSLEDYSTTHLPEMEVGVMEGENELELGTTEIIATIAEAKTISETLPISKGGTGATTRYEAEYNLLGESGTVETTITDERLFALRNQTVSASNGAMRWIKCSVIWTYIQNKISSILGLTASAYNGTAAKASADANGANIADTYATKTALSDEAVARSETDETLQANIDSVVANLTSETTARENADADLQTAINAKASIESVNSLGQSVSALTNSVNGKLDLNGSNASSTTTYNVLNSAAGGGSVDFSNDEEIITTYPTGQVAYKRTLEKFGDWVLGIVNRKLNSWFGNEQEVVFNDVKVRQGIDSAEVQVATYYGISQSYYDKEYIDDEVSALNESVDSKIGFEEVKNITNSGMATNAATSSLPVTIFYAGSGGSIASIYKAYVANAQEPLFLTCGRCIYLVNTTASNVTITGLTKGNYTLDAGRAMTIIYYTGTSGEFWYSPDVSE